MVLVVLLLFRLVGVRFDVKIHDRRELHFLTLKGLLNLADLVR